jgi:uncharacterized protein YciI
MKQLFAISYAPGPSWVQGKPIVEQPIQAHLSYMTTLSKRGVLLLGGPYTNAHAGLGIVMAASPDAAHELAAADPCVQSGLLTATVNPWKVVLTGAAAMTSWLESVQ